MGDQNRLFFERMCQVASTGGIAIYQFLESRSHPRARQRAVNFGTAALAILVVTYLIANQTSQIGASEPGITANPTSASVQQSAGNNPGLEPTTQILPTPTPTPNPCSSKPSSGTVLYQADWSTDPNGWVVAGDWTALGGSLESAGNGTPPIFAPYRPGDYCITDYAVEAKITLIKYNDQQEDSFGLIIRADSNGGGYTLSICAKEKYAFGTIVASCADSTGGSQNY